MFKEEADRALEGFSENHPRGTDDMKAPGFYKEIAQSLKFTEQKIGFIVVPHMVHTLPYFLQALTSLGSIVAIIPKSSKYVPEVEVSLDQIYRPFIRRDINKTVLNTEPDKVDLFLQELSARYQDRQFMILDHGGYFASRLDVLHNHKMRLAGIVEHTWNGDIKYRNALHHSPFPCPVFSIARNSLKAAEDAHVGASIVHAMSAKVFAGSGISQDITRLKIGVIGYGHMGEAIAKYLLRIVPSGNIKICDEKAEKSAEARKSFSAVFADIKDLLSDGAKDNDKCDVIIAAANAPILGRDEFEQMKSGTCVVCVTSGDDQFKPDYLTGLQKIGETAAVTTYRRPRGDNIYFAYDGRSVNFSIGSTPHPILHAVLGSVCASAFRCLTTPPAPLSAQSFSTIQELPAEDVDIIEDIYRRTFDPVTDLDVRIQKYCQELVTSDTFEDLTLYVPISGSLRPRNSDIFDLNEKIQNFNESRKKVLLLLGESGSGKSLFGKFLERDMAHKYLNGSSKIIPVFVSLPMFSEPKYSLIEQALLRYGFSSTEIDVLKATQSFLCIFDSYDEAYLQDNLYRSNELQKWRAKVIITCRSDYLTPIESYQMYFTPFIGESAEHNALQEVHVAPFSPEQINIYIDQYVAAKQKELTEEIARQAELKEDWLVPDTYKRRIEQIRDLKGLVQTPFLLKITMETLPKLVEQHEEAQALQQDFRMTHKKLYDAFIERWFARQEEKLMGLGRHPGHSMYKHYFAFAEGLAKAMHMEKVTQVYYVEESDVISDEVITQSKWAKYFSDDYVTTDRGDANRRAMRIAARKGCPLRRLGVNQYGFIHNSLLNYFIARLIKEGLSPATSTSTTSISASRFLNGSSVQDAGIENLGSSSYSYAASASVSIATRPLLLWQYPNVRSIGTTDREILALDAVMHPGIVGSIKDGAERYDGFAIAADLKIIFGDLMVDSRNVVAGHNIITSVAMDRAALRGRIHEILDTCNVKFVAGAISKDVWAHIPICHQPVHWNLLSMRITRSTEGTAKIINFEMTDSLSSVSGGVAQVKDYCSEDTWFDAAFTMQDRASNRQVGNSFCGDYTIQEALRRTGWEIVGIATDNSQDGANGICLREATIALIRNTLRMTGSAIRGCGYG